MGEFDNFWYRSADGLDLYARDYATGHTRTDGAVTILCIPGLTRNSADFHELCLYLRDRYRVIAVDLRGRGRSGYAGSASSYTPATYREDIERLITVAGLERVVFVGTSLGAIVSMLIAAGDPPFLRGLVLNDLGPEIHPAGLTRIKSYVGKEGAVATWGEAVARTREVHGGELPGLSDGEWLTFTRNLYRQDRLGRPSLDYDPEIATTFEDQPESLWPVYDALPVGVPVLLLRGELSDLLSRHCVEEMQRRRPQLMVAEVPGRGHAPLLNEATSLAAIDQLLQQVGMPPVR